MKYILISTFALLFSACSQTAYNTLNYQTTHSCQKNPNSAERRECEKNAQRTFQEYEKEIQNNESKL